MVLLAVAGCGGGKGGAHNAELSGIVTDINGDIVRNAKVWINGFGETTTNSSGAYVLKSISEGDWVVRAEITQDDIRYKGENVARIFDGERTKSLNITICRASQQARIFGTVIDRDGHPIGGARVFAISADVDTASSTLDITDSQGRFNLDSLLGGIDYAITASARGFNNDNDTINIDSGDEREVVFTLGDATDPLLPAPTGFEAVIWTSPQEATRSVKSQSAINYIKSLFDKRTPKQSQTRLTVDGNWIETDLFWDIYPSNNAHIGYGIYRRFGNSGPFTAVDFLRDPLANIYEDNDEDLHENETWSYAISAINTNYPDTNNSESDLSTAAVVHSLGDMNVNPIQLSPVKFSWQAASGAEEYAVFVFDEYPGINWNPPFWTSSRTAALNLNYSGPALTPGHHYFYVVLGFANSDSSKTISPVFEFVAN